MKKTGAQWDPFFLLYTVFLEYMNKYILTIALASASLLVVQGEVAFAVITPDEIVSLVNQERGEAGLSSLEQSHTLDLVAEAKANDMAVEQYFSHTSPKGITPWEWFRNENYEYRYAGENLAIHFRDAVLEQRAWMESKKHCENIMSPKYLEIGVAVREMEWEGKQTTIAVQMFGTRMTDEKKLNLSEKGDVTCPKRYPSVLGASLPADNNGGIVGAVFGFLADTSSHFKIDTGRLLALAFFAGAQIAGIFIVFILVMRNQWVRKW